VTFDDLAKKKVLGVPVLYLGAAFVTILAIIAWRMKPAADTTTAGTNPEDGTAGASGDGQTTGQLAGTTDPYGGLDTNGTIVVQPSDTTASPGAQPTNETWLGEAVPYVASTLKMSSGTVQVGLNKYLNGDDLTYDEGRMRDTALDKFGLPPEGTTGFGQTGSQPAQKQFSVFPGKHVVKNSNDNTSTKLAVLYYGNGDWAHSSFIAAHNPSLGPTGNTYVVGTAISIPDYTRPHYYSVPKGVTTFAQVAAKNGTTSQIIQLYNPQASQPLKAGQTLRVA